MTAVENDSAFIAATTSTRLIVSLVRDEWCKDTGLHVFGSACSCRIVEALGKHSTVDERAWWLPLERLALEAFPSAVRDQRRGLLSDLFDRRRRAANDGAFQ